MSRSPAPENARRWAACARACCQRNDNTLVEFVFGWRTNTATPWSPNVDHGYAHKTPQFTKLPGFWDHEGKYITTLAHCGLDCGRNGYFRPPPMPGPQSSEFREPQGVPKRVRPLGRRIGQIEGPCHTTVVRRPQGTN